MASSSRRPIYIANPDIQPGKKGQNNQQARVTQNYHNDGLRIPVGRTTGDADGAGEYQDYAQGAALMGPPMIDGFNGGVWQDGGLLIGNDSPGSPEKRGFLFG